MCPNYITEVTLPVHRLTSSSTLHPKREENTSRAWIQQCSAVQITQEGVDQKDLTNRLTLLKLHLVTGFSEAKLSVALHHAFSFQMSPNLLPGCRMWIHRVPVWVRGHRNAHRNSCHIKQRPTTRQAHPETLCTRRWAWRFDSHCSCITDCLQVSCCSRYMTAWTLNQPEEDRLDFLFFNIAGKFNIFPVGE